MSSETRIKREGVLSASPQRLTLDERIYRFPWGLLLALLAILGMGLGVLYSATGGDGEVLFKQGLRVGVMLALFFALALSGDKLFRHNAYVIYFGVLLLLVAVFAMGHIGMGARRWIDLGVVRLQPSELMKVALAIALARWFHDRSVAKSIGLKDLLGPVVLISLPLVFILKQPDLGTAVAVAVVGMAVVFVAGLSWKVLLGAVVMLGAAMPMVWNSLHDYQRRRVETLLSPESDPLGAGYHIIQSKIAVGSGGVLGKGYLAGSQNLLNFLPERHTDFIFSVLAEEWGFVGAMVLLGLYAIVVARGLSICITARNRFGMLLAVGMVTMLGLQVVINVGMVVGMLPVVGIPLPLVSYGGSSLLTTMVAMGLLAHVSIHSKSMSRTV
ncbi:cell elongation-specific peptidoglycan biosynthesis regulator RodA [Magnetococcus marinus MC-1]|uniref:Peptidoglycan glycosyltransferase MrdB n=1 Tax=Magnetococcus marinus (strain ATCC BAA-1437 / JCM 17883 / MC-1) TaxID=156889 RepID=A0L7I4_MAGMM|nr:rod shape-determining protein RodA [Magnetococcus marinus]ABK43927.1 cell elongation-specific peptidoglycan biosynthesis regulator RodA [Magnetococcus marinus MC-1]